MLVEFAGGDVEAARGPSPADRRAAPGRSSRATRSRPTWSRPSARRRGQGARGRQARGRAAQDHRGPRRSATSRTSSCSSSPQCRTTRSRSRRSSTRPGVHCHQVRAAFEVGPETLRRRPRATKDRALPASPAMKARSFRRRVLLKLSGEVFGGGRLGVDPDIVSVDRPRRSPRSSAAAPRSPSSLAAATSSAAPSSRQRGMDRARADYMGMLGTVMNCLALQDFLEKHGRPDPRADRPSRWARSPSPTFRAARERHLEKGRVVIFGAGVGAPVLLHRHRRGAARAGDRLSRCCARRRTASTASTTPTRAITPRRSSSTP